MSSITKEQAEIRLQECADVLTGTINGSLYKRETIENKISILESNIRYIDHSKNMFAHYDIDYSEAETAKANAINYINSVNA